MFQPLRFECGLRSFAGNSTDTSPSLRGKMNNQQPAWQISIYTFGNLETRTTWNPLDLDGGGPISGPEKHLDTGVYHCQQAAENTRAEALSCMGKSRVWPGGNRSEAQQALKA